MGLSDDITELAAAREALTAAYQAQRVGHGDKLLDRAQLKDLVARVDMLQRRVDLASGRGFARVNIGVPRR